MRTPKTPLIAVALAAVCVASAQTKPVVKPKPAPKPAAQAPATRPVLGTAQLPGDDGKLNQAYTMGKQGKFNIVLTGVRYAKVRWTHDDENLAPDRDHKLMILSFQVQNPNKEETQFNDATFTFTAIDQEGENHEGVSRVIQKNGTKDLNLMMKPAQRIDCETAILVPAKGVVPKLMVAHRSGGDVLRYDLHDAIQALEKPYSENGTDAAAEIAGEPNTYYAMLDSDVKYASTAFQERQLGNNTCDASKEIFMLSRVTFKMQTPVKGFMRFEGEAVDENGDRYPCTSIRKASTEEHMASYAEPGQEVNGRMAFVVPKGVKIAKMRVFETTRGKSEVIEFPVDAYATADGQPLQKEAAKPKGGTEAATGDADAYTTLLNKGDGTTKAMEFDHVERRDESGKTTLISAGGRQAILVEAADTTTLAFLDTKEVLRAPKATGKDPLTSLDYYEMAYANGVAPKKKKSFLGSIAPALPLVANVVTGGAAAALMGGGALSSFGSMAAPMLVQGASQMVQGVMVQQMQAKLGRATMNIQQPTEAGAARTSDTVTIDGKTFASTSYKGKAALDATYDASSAKDVDAKEMYKRFTEFMTKGLG